MKLKSLIEILQQEYDKHGDLPVNYHFVDSDISVKEIRPYNIEGNAPTADLPAVEIFIH